MVKQEHACTSPIDPVCSSAIPHPGVVFTQQRQPAPPLLIFGSDTGGGGGQDAPLALLTTIPIFPPDGGGGAGGGDAPMMHVKMIPFRPGITSDNGGERYPIFPDENPTGGGGLWLCIEEIGCKAGKRYPVFPEDNPIGGGSLWQQFSACDDDPQPVGEAPLMHLSPGPIFVQPIRCGTISLPPVSARPSFPKDPSGGGERYPRFPDDDPQPVGERYTWFSDEDGDKGGKRATMLVWLLNGVGGVQ